MNTQMLSDEVAYRIALASKSLPSLSVREMIDALHLCLQDFLQEDDVLTENLLSKVTVTQLKTALGQTYTLDGEEDGEGSTIPLPVLKNAVEILWGETEEILDDLPKIDPYQEGDMPESIRIAVASNQGEELDGHFGSCLRYLIYQLSKDELRLIDIRSAEKAQSAEDKNAFRVSLIEDCHVVYIISVGGPAAAKVIKQGVYPIKIQEGGQARSILADLQKVIQTSPPPWMAKALGHSLAS
jgi:nitrogen fixation protein NifX